MGFITGGHSNLTYRVTGADGSTYVLQQYRPDVTLDPAWAALEPFSAAEVERLAALCTPYFDRVLVRSG